MGRTTNGPQYTERTEYGQYFSYRVSEPGETFPEFMSRSPFYSRSAGVAAWDEIEAGLKRRGGAYEFGWSRFTYTEHEARRQVTVQWFERQRNDRCGNPRWRLHTDVGHFDTEPGASVGYGISNMTNSRIPETYILNDAPVHLVLNKRGRIVDIERNGRSLDK